MALDEADIKQISELVAASLKAARDEDEKKSNTKLTKLAKEIEEKIAKVKPANAEGDDDGEPGEDGDDPDAEPAKGKKKPPVRESAADKKLQASVAKLEKQYAEEKAAREKAEKAQAESRLINAAREALGEHGVKNMKAALAILHNTEQRLKFTEAGEPGIHFKRDGYEEILPMAEGLAEWLKTEDGLGVLPPKNAQGTGTGNAGNPVVTQKGEINTRELGNKLGAALNNLSF